MVRGTLGAMGLVLLLLLAGCPSSVPSPLVGQTRFTCCNLHYEKPEIADVNFQVGTMVPLGTRVQILSVGRHEVKFQPEGHPPLTLVLKYGKESLGLEQYVDRVLVTDDPRARLRKLPARTQKLIEQGAVEPGMRRNEVLMSLGYPPAHRTPTLEQNDWHYWQNRWHQFVVFFSGDKVDRIQN